MKTYVTQTYAFTQDNLMIFYVKPYSKLVDVNIAHNIFYATFESPIEPIDCNKQFEIRLTNTFSVPPFDLSFHGTVKKSDVNITVTSSGGSAQFSPELLETIYMVYYKEIKPAEEIRDERIEEVFE
jgi:siroheme synthase (precorrin-2 oxidase/ferrochelatase)